MNPERKLNRVVIEWTNGESLSLSQMEIERMVKAGDALELIQNAKEVASKLVRL